MPRPGSTAATGIGYGGEYRDGTGLINLRARSYDPVLTRFIGRDTFGGVASAPQTGNRYAYALSNPLRYSDPSGHFVNKVIHDPSLLLGAAAFIPGPVGLAALGMLGAIAGITALTGTDPLTGQQVEGPARFVGLALFAVPIFGKVVGSAAEAWGEVGALGRSATETEAALADGVRLGEAGAGEAEAGVGAVARASEDVGVAATDELGIVYRRIDRAGGKPYIGQAKSMTRYEARQVEHQLDHPSAFFNFEIVGRAQPGTDLDRLEEYFIRQEGGPTNASNPIGLLANKRHQMSDLRYVTAGGDPWEWLNMRP